MGSPYALSLKVQSTTSLPPHLGLAFNGESVDLDECKLNPNDTSEWAPIRFNADRTQAEIFYILDDQIEDFSLYFYQDATGPSTNSLDLIISSRATCEGASSTIKRLDGIQLSWTPIYANGEDCGTTSQIGKADISF